MRKTMITCSELRHLVDIGFLGEDGYKYFVFQKSINLYKGMMENVFCGSARRRLHVKMDALGYFQLTDRRHPFGVPQFVLSRNYRTICRIFGKESGGAKPSICRKTTNTAVSTEWKDEIDNKAGL